jgi:hypothetical protein
MAKTAHLPDIFDEDWFLALHPYYQFFYLFVSARANKAGIWRPNKTSFEKNRNIKIDLDKFLEQVNSVEVHISILPDNTWFLNYHISSNLGNIYNPRYTTMVSALKIAFLSGVPLEWIKGFSDPEKIDKEAIENSYTKKQTMFVSGMPTENIVAPKINNNTERKRETKVKQLKGIVPNFMMPEITYTDRGGSQDIQIELWLDEYDFQAIVENKNIHSSELLNKCVIEFIKDAQEGSFKPAKELQNYFKNWMRSHIPKGPPLTMNSLEDPPTGKTSNGKFGSLKKYQEMKPKVDVTLQEKFKNENNIT